MGAYGTEADRALQMAHVMAALREKLERHRPEDGDTGEAARLWQVVWGSLCTAEKRLLRQTPRRGRVR